MPDEVIEFLPDERPLTFQALLPDEKAWRARLFLMTWILYGSEAYAWSIALAADSREEDGVRESVEAVDDEQIVEAARIAMEERARW